MWLICLAWWQDLFFVWQNQFAKHNFKLLMDTQSERFFSQLYLQIMPLPEVKKWFSSSLWLLAHIHPCVYLCVSCTSHRGSIQGGCCNKWSCGSLSDSQVFHTVKTHQTHTRFSIVAAAQSEWSILVWGELQIHILLAERKCQSACLSPQRDVSTPASIVLQAPLTEKRRAVFVFCDSFIIRDQEFKSQISHLGRVNCSCSLRKPSF